MIEIGRNTVINPDKSSGILPIRVPGLSEKFLHRWFGPFIVIEKWKSNNVYKVYNTKSPYRVDVVPVTRMKPWTGREILQDFSDLYEEPITDKHKDINKSSNELIYENTSEPNVVPNTSASKNTTALKTSLDQLKEQLKISFDQKRLERRKNMRSQKQNQMCSRKHRSVQLN